MSRDEQVAARRYHVPAAEMYDEPHPEWRTVEVVRASDPDEPSATRCPYCGEPKVAHELISPTTCVLGSKSGYLPKSSSSSDCAAPDASSAASLRADDVNAAIEAAREAADRILVEEVDFYD